MMRNQIKRRAKAHKQAQRERGMLISGAVITLAMLLLIAAYLVWDSGRVTPTAFAYSPDEVTRENGFTATHEMGSGPPIPFLPANGPQPKISLSAVNHNFGRIGPRDVLSQTFAIRNDGAVPLTISRAYTTCGCTSAEFSASVIPPAAQVEIADAEVGAVGQVEGVAQVREQLLVDVIEDRGHGLVLFRKRLTSFTIKTAPLV
jgi:hypothetical protein